jgi:hypothetical protein
MLPVNWLNIALHKITNPIFLDVLFLIRRFQFSNSKIKIIESKIKIIESSPSLSTNNTLGTQLVIDLVNAHTYCTVAMHRSTVDNTQHFLDRSGMGPSVIWRTVCAVGEGVSQGVWCDIQMG